MHGIVQLPPSPTGFLVVLMDDKTYTVLGNCSGPFAAGDQLSGDLQTLGSENIINDTQDQPITAIVEDCYCSRDRAFMVVRKS